MSRLLAILWVILLSVPASWADQPNILFLLTDDQRPDTIRALGNNLIETPHLDGLVRQGLTFTRAVCTHPICVPSRAEILTGCSGFRNGMMPGHSDRFREDLAWWPEVMRQAGYHTWYVGKWHTAGRPSTRGYEDTLGLYSSGAPNPPEQADFKGRPVTGYRNWVFQTDDRKLFPDKGIGLTPNISSEFADAAIELLKRKRTRPFFLHVNFTAPHDPLLLPPGNEKKYDPAKMPLPPNFLPRHPFDHGNFEGRDEKLLPWPRTEKDIKEELAAYYAVISHLDEQVGRILKTLEETGQAKNTLVIFASDHGLGVGSHGLRGKQNMYEHTINIPLILRGPGVPAGKRTASQVHLRDLFPTVCEFAGIKIPEAVEAKSFAPVLSDPTREIHPEVFCYFRDAQRMIRTDRWKLIWYPQVKRWQLFDLKEDPHEMKDLSDNPRMEETLRDLKRRLAAHQKKANDPLSE